MLLRCRLLTLFSTGFLYSCSGSKCKKLLASLGGREVPQALDDPALIVALAKFRQAMPQLFHVLKRAHPQELLFQRADEPLHAAIALRLAHEGRRRLHAQEGDLRLVVVAQVLAAVVVPVANAGRGPRAESAAVVSHPLPERLQGLEARGFLGRGKAHALARAVIYRLDNV